MELSAVDPRWTARAPTMRVLDPLGAESTEGSLQNRLLRPVLSIAITQRLRYLSYWSWVTAHVENHTPEERALYEKVLLVASTHHDCPSTGTGTSGIMGGTEQIEKQLDGAQTNEIDISPEAFTITSSDKARFDSYYKGVLYRLLLFENEWTLTPLGEKLATAYEAAIDFSFDEVQTAVKTKQLPMDLIERATHSGCLCQLSDREQEILTQAYWFLVTPTDTYEELNFAPDPHPDLLQLETLLNKKMAPEDESDAAIEATIAGIDSIEDEDYSEDLDRFFSTGRDAFVRSSLVLLLSLGDWVQRRPTPDPPFGPLQDARETWRLLVHAEYASYALQALFIAVMEAVKQLEPISPGELLTTLFAHQQFDRAVNQTLTGVSLTERDEQTRSTLTGIRDAVYFGEAPTNPVSITTTETDAVDSFAGTWEDICEQLQATDPEATPFTLSGYSERAYRTLLSETLSEPRSIEKSRRVAAYSSVFLARLATRQTQYFGQDAMEPYVAWFKTAHEDPGAVTIWRLNDTQNHSYENQTPGQQTEDWPASPFALTVAGFTRQWILNHYFDRLYTKLRDSNGRSPQLLHIDSEGMLTFDHEINDGAIYNGGTPNAPTLKFDRLGDILYELGLIEDNTLSNMHVTDRGRQLVTAFTTGGTGQHD